MPTMEVRGVGFFVVRCWRIIIIKKKKRGGGDEDMRRIPSLVHHYVNSSVQDRPFLVGLLYTS